MKIILLIDPWAHRSLGGLPQVQRILLNVAEWVERAERQSSAKPSVLTYEKTDSPDKVTDYLQGETAPVLILKTSLVLGRWALRRLTASLTAPPLVLLDQSWDGLSQYFDRQVPESAPKRSKGDGLFWDVLRQESDLATVEKGLFDSLRKPTDGFVARSLNRPISLGITRFLAKFSITPNQYTCLVFLLSPAFFLVLSTGTWWGFVLGTFLFHLSNVLDGCDGEIARLKFMESKLGERADTVVDQVSNHLFVLGIGLGLSRSPGMTDSDASFYLWEGILTAALMMATVWSLTKIAKPEDGKYNFSDFGKTFVEEMRGKTWARKGLFSLTQLIRRDTYAFAFLFFPLLGRSDWILHSLFLGVLAYILILSVKLAKALPAGPIKYSGKHDEAGEPNAS